MMKKGFTLIEVTVALALFALAVVVLSQSFLGGMLSLESFKFDDSEDGALRYVYSKVIAMEKRSDVENGGSIATVDKGVAKWDAKIQTTPVLELYKLTIHVFFEEEKRSTTRKDYFEDLYVHRPAWAARGERDEFLRGKMEHVVL